MVRIVVSAQVWDAARDHLDIAPERVGFFLADWEPDSREFRVREWRAVVDVEDQLGQLHVVLSDEARKAVIAWASAEDACLIEAHSHGRWSPARFSAFDRDAFEAWIPHLWWRLSGRPYGALVTSTVDFDAIAWIDGPHVPQQVECVVTDHVLPATKATLSARAMAQDG